MTDPCINDVPQGPGDPSRATLAGATMTAEGLKNGLSDLVKRLKVCNDSLFGLDPTVPEVTDVPRLEQGAFASRLEQLNEDLAEVQSYLEREVSRLENGI